MENYLRHLSLKLASLGHILEANRVMVIRKMATLAGIKTLGIKDSAAKIFESKIGSKWSYIIAKWWLESNLRGQSFEEYIPFFGEKSDSIDIIKAIGACDLLLATPLDEREAIFSKNRDCKALLRWIKANDLSNPKYLWTSESIDPILVRYYGKEEISPDDRISSYKEELKERLSKGIDYFISDSFIQDLINNLFVTPGQAKDLSYKEALAKWSKNKPDKFPVVLQFEDGWKWVDAGGGRSSWVRDNLSNCGSVSWGNLRATEESKTHAKMLILMDEFLKPHAIATWNPLYRESDDQPPVKYLGYIEGVSSKVLEDKFYHYATALKSFLKPDIINVPSRSTYDVDGRYHSNDNLIEELNKVASSNGDAMLEKLTNYLSGDNPGYKEIIAMYPEHFLSWAAKKGLDKRINKDAILAGDLQSISEEMAERYYKSNESIFQENLDDGMDSATYPSWINMEYLGPFEMGWLIHLCKDSQSIADYGFLYGVQDHTKLGFTVGLSDDYKAGPGYNFAFDARDSEAISMEHDYGSEAVLFRAKGIMVYHHLDGQQQIIFYGPDARDIIPLKFDGNHWTAGSLDKTFDDIEELINWVISNFNQYQTELLARAKV